MDKNIELTSHGLVCDNPDCSWEDMSIAMEDYGQYVNMPCPDCGQNVLTEEDYNQIVSLVNAVHIANKMTKEEIDEMVKGLSMQQIDSALDLLNDMGFKKTGENPDGTENWESVHKKHKDNRSS
ncbi:MAG: hypothetical protein ACFFKA_19650 [Candidatus Thorarchaeota archaeon]